MNTIHLKGDFRREEAVAAGTVKPGMLLALTSLSKVQAHGVEGGAAERAFAVEDALQGKTISNSYAATDLVSYNLMTPGSEVNALIKAGEDIAVGTFLVSAGDGTLIAEASVASGTTVVQRIAVAVEAIDLTGSGDVDTLAAVRLL